MKVRIQGMLATSAAAAALIASAGIAQADGMPGGPAFYDTRPALWTGIYVGGESGWNEDNYHVNFTDFGTHAGSTKDGVNVGLFLGAQYQFGSIVVGAEANLIGNEFDFADNKAVVNGNGNCPNPTLNCVGRVTDVFTIGPRIGFAIGNWMPYATGGYASGSVNFRAINAAGVATEWADNRQDGYYIGGGLDWKVSHHVIVGIEYRHTDLGTGPTQFDFNPVTGANVEHVQQRAESDSVMLRGSLIFNPIYGPAPLK